MRDLVLFGVLAALVFTVPTRPFIGALAWVVFGVMNPHRLTWGPAFSFPFALVIVVLTFIGLLITKEHRKLKGGAAAAMLLVFFGWTCVTTVFAIDPDRSFEYLVRVFKVMMMTGVLLLLTHTRRQVELILWCLVISLGFYGIKGAVFVVGTGGTYMVNGPPDSVMEGNNALGVGLVMVIPLLYYLYQEVKQTWVRRALLVSMVMCAVSVLGTYSRGALLAVLAMSLLLWWRGKQKLRMMLVAVTFALVAVPFMPDEWTSRMNTIQTYGEDSSAMGRITAWETAYTLAKDKFPIGGGYEWTSRATFDRYAPPGAPVLVSHSIYFQVLGSQGFFGLLLFLLFWWLVWRQCVWLRRQGRGTKDLVWAYHLGSMLQVSVIGFLVGGAFLDLAFWDLPYYLFAAAAGACHVVQNSLKGQAASPAVVAAKPPVRAHPATGNPTT